MIFASSAQGEKCVTLSQDLRLVVLEHVFPGSPFPEIGEKVTCVSPVGEWTSTVTACRDGQISLAAPNWLGRSVPRRWPRVNMHSSATILIDGERWAGQLLNLSLGGGALMIERACKLERQMP